MGVRVLSVWRGLVARPCRGVMALCVLCAASAALAFGAAPALALEFGGAGEGAGQLEIPSGGGVAVDHATGNIYVADEENNRVDEFSAGGVFVRAWGWEVDKSAPKKEWQECTGVVGVSECKKGVSGGGAGQLLEPRGVAVDEEAGQEAVFVLDRGNNRVDKFTLEGKFVLTWGKEVNKTTKAGLCTAVEVAGGNECQAGKTGTGTGQFTSMGYQGAIAVSAAGAVYVGDKERVQWFSAEGVYESSFLLAGKLPVEAVAVALSGDVYVTVGTTETSIQAVAPEVRKYTPSGTLAGTIALVKPKAGKNLSVYLAADGSGDLFVDEYMAENEAGEATQQITEYSEALGALEAFGPPGGEASNRTLRPSGLALSEASKKATGTVLARGNDKVYGAPLPAPGPVVEGEEAKGEPAGCARLTAIVNPEHLSTTYQFAYGLEPAKEALSAVVTMKAHEVSPEAVSALVCGLYPERLYYYHVIAKNTEGTAEGARGAGEASVETLPALKVDGLAVGEVSAEGVTFAAYVDPVGTETHYRFEYEPVGSGKVSYTPERVLGPVSEDVAVSEPVQGLEAGREYVYRVVARDTLAVGEPPSPETFSAQREGRFLTQAAGAPLALLDGRAWEQVSPPDKGSALIDQEAEATMVQAAADGGAVTYESLTGSEASPEGETISDQIVSRHGADGWSSRDIATPNERRYDFGLEEESYRFFSQDLSRAVVEPYPYTKLSRWTSERTEYLREEAKCPKLEDATEAQREELAPECFVPLLTDEGPFKDVEPGVEFGGPAETSGNLYANGNTTAVGSTPELSSVVLAEKEPTNGLPTPEPLVAGGGVPGLYERTGTTIAPVSVLSGAGEEPLNGCRVTFGALGENQFGPDTRNAVSPDGGLVVWSEAASGSGCHGGHLYVRDLAGRATSQLDVVQSGAGLDKAEPVYQDASVGDRHIFFTDSQRLTEGASATETGVSGATKTTSDLYEAEYEPGSGAVRVTDMTEPVNAGEAAAIQGVLGASEDGSLVYVVAQGVLSANEVEYDGRKEKAVSGGDNLYLLERSGDAWRARFIATLSSEDQPVWASSGNVAEDSAQVSPDGRWLAFMSERSLTGYDNEDVSSKRPGEVMDEEVFLYSAASHSLVCPSCDPSGARPHGIFARKAEGQSESTRAGSSQSWVHRWLAGWLAMSYRSLPTGELAHQPRFLSDGGRLFFSAADGLVAQDVNSVADVYEYEPPPNGEVAGSDSCVSASEAYVAGDLGCVGLVSSGTSPYPSRLLDASENGDDVFFVTAEKLASSDIDTTYDVYDAHVCGSGWECSASAVVTPPCDDAESCRAAPEAQPSIYGSPASATFSGPGNAASVSGSSSVSPPAPKKTVKKKTAVKCAKGKRRVRGKCVKTKKGKGKAKGSRAASVGKAGETGRGK